MKGKLLYLFVILTMLVVVIPAAIPVVAADGGSISGYVYKENGTTPIDGATVSAWNHAELLPALLPPEGVDTTDASGYFSITDIPAGDYKVAAWADGHERLFYPDINYNHLGDPVTVTEGQDTYPINFSLSPGSTISGVIRNADGSTTLANVSISASLPGEVGAHSVALTDENGNYTLDGLPYDTYTVMAPIWTKSGRGDDGYIVETYQERSAFGGYDPVTVDEGVNPTGIDFTLEVGGTISGHVEDGNGDPIAPNPIFIWDYNSLQGQWLIMAVAIIDENGDYESTGLPVGLYAVQARCDGYAWEWYNETYYKDEAASVQVTLPGNQPDIDFVLGPACSISGHVQDSEGDPIVGIHVSTNDYNSNRWVNGVNTNALGNYTLVGLPAGSYRVKTCAQCSGMSYINKFYNNTYFYDSAEEVILTPSANITGIDFSLELGAAISGHVYESGGMNPPVENAQVEVIEYDTLSGWWHHYGGVSTDENGYYRTSGLPDGSYGVRVIAGGYAAEWYNDRYYKDDADAVPVAMPDDTEDIDFYLEPGGSISGHVQDKDGDPIVNLHVFASDNETNQWVIGTNTDSSGNYTIYGLLEGGYTVMADPYGVGLPFLGEWYDDVHTSWEDADTVTVVPPDDTGGIDFTLEALPDLTITAKWEEWAAGYNYTVHYTVKNIGESPALPGHHVGLLLPPLVDPLFMEEVTVSLPPGESYTGNFNMQEITLTGDCDSVVVIADINNNIYEQNEHNNARNNTFGKPAGPDLFISVKYEEWVGEGIYKVYYTLTNVGNALAPGGDHHITLFVDEVPMPSPFIGIDLAPGESFSGSFNYDITLSDNYDVVKLCADGDNVIEELNEDNNCRENTIAWPPKPDLVILPKTEEWVGQDAYNVYFAVRNIGNDIAPAGSNVTMTIDGAFYGSIELPRDLAPGSLIACQFLGIELSGYYDEITICADVDHEVTESREDNNCTTNYWPEPPPEVIVSINAPEYVLDDSDFEAYVDITQVTDLNAAQYDIWFDPAVLRLDDVSDGYINSTNISATYNVIDPGHVRAVNSMGLSTANGSGFLAVLHFHSVGALCTGSDIDITDGILSGWESEIPATWLGGHVNICIPGDANCDGDVNVIDMTKVARIILEIDDPTCGADANRDGSINIYDMTKIARIILGLDPQYGGTLKLAGSGNIYNMGNPNEICNIGDSTYGLTALERLMMLDSAGNLQPWLAKSWEIAPDGSYVTFHLRKGVKFHDGTDFNAEAAKFNIDIHINGSVWGDLESVESCDVIDPYTVRLNFVNGEFNWVAMKSLASFWPCSMFSATALQTQTAEWLRTHPVGTGPFTFVEYQPDNYVTFVRFFHYWGGMPYLDGVTYIIIPDTATQIAAFKAGEIHAVAFQPENAADLIASGFQVQENTASISNSAIIPDSTNIASPFSDIRVRRALAHAIDKELIVAGLTYGYGIVSNQPFIQGHPAYNPAVVGYPYNPDKAKQYLAEADYTGGFNTQLIVVDSTSLDVPIAIEDHAAQVGINIQINSVGWGEYYNLITTGWEGLLYGSNFTGSTTDPAISLTSGPLNDYLIYVSNYEPPEPSYFGGTGDFRT